MKKNLTVIFLCLSFFACNIINKDEPLPIYIAVPQPHVLVDAKTNYESDLGVKVIWAEAGIDSFGYFAVPKTFPVFPGASKNYFFFGGISDLGQGFVAQYPFWKPVQQHISVKDLDTFKFNKMTFEYYSDTILHYEFVEQFESPSILFRKAAASELEIDFYGQDKLERAHSGLLQFNSIQKIADIESENLLNLPYNQAVYLEASYKSDINFIMGLKYQTNSGLTGDAPLFATVTASPDKWKTVYFRLNNVMASIENGIRNDGAKYRIYFKSDGEGKDVKILLDNIRVIYRK